MTAALNRFHQADLQLAAAEGQRAQLYADLHDLEIEEQVARTVLLRCAHLKTDVQAQIQALEHRMLRLAADQLYLVQGEQAGVRHDAEQHRRTSGQLRREQVVR